MTSYRASPLLSVQLDVAAEVVTRRPVWSKKKGSAVALPFLLQRRSSVAAALADVDEPNFAGVAAVHDRNAGGRHPRPTIHTDIDPVHSW